MPLPVHAPSGFEKTVGLLFGFLVFGLVAYTIVYEVDLAGPKGQMLFVLVAVAVGGMFSVVPGFLNFSYNRAGVVVRAAGGAAAFAGVLWLGQGWAEGGRGAVQPLPTPAPAPAPAPAPVAPRAEIDPVAWLAQALQGVVPTSYYASASCGWTGAWGIAQAADPASARAMAVQICVGYGGPYECCLAGASVTP